MENSLGKGKVGETSKKSRSVDLQKLYTSGFSNEGRGKGNSGGGADEVRKTEKRKSRKEVALSSFEPKVKRSRNSFVDGASAGSVKSDGSVLGLGQSSNRSNGLNGVSLSLDGSGNVIRIPRKPRGSVGRKSHVTKPSGSSSSVDQNAKLNYELNKGRTARVSSHQHAKKEGDQLVADNGNGVHSSSRKGQSNHRGKRKALSPESLHVAEKVEPAVDYIGSVSEDSQDDEENLERNAARMLSSRFDPRWTKQSSKSKTSLTHSSRNGGNYGENMQAGSQSPSADRVLRPRNTSKEKGSSRKRRHFYEVAYRDKDANWFLNRRIKVFWPLDNRWYHGLVKEYDEEKQLHHVKYDDREEEWISLDNEQFKLLLLPSEVTNEEKPKESVLVEKITGKSKKDLTMSDMDTNIGSHTDSEPIISWLARSSHRSKSSSGLKKQKTFHSSLNALPTLSNKICKAGADDDMRLLKRDTNEVCSGGLADRLSDAEKGEKSVLECTASSKESLGNGEKGEKSVWERNTSSKDRRLPIVYFRRRFRKQKEGSCSTSVNTNVHTRLPRYVTSVSGNLDPDKILWLVDSSGMLKLNMAILPSKEFKTLLSLPLRPLLEYTFGTEILRLLHFSLLLQYGAIVITWPKVRMEVLFVDNVVGLRFFLFEGCMKQVVAFVFLVLSVFCDPSEPRKFVELQMPATSIRFKLSCTQDNRKQHVFAFYSFSKLKYSSWLYLDSMFERHCLFTKQLPLVECTLDNIKALERGSKQVHINSVWCQDSFQAAEMKSFQGILPVGLSKPCNVNRKQSPNSDAKHGMLLPFALSFSAAPTFFLSLHLKLLMESSIACVSLQDQEHDPVPPELLGNIYKSTVNVAKCSSEDPPQVQLYPKGTLETCLPDGPSSRLFSCSKPHLGTDPVSVRMDCGSMPSQHPKTKKPDVVATYTCFIDSGGTIAGDLDRVQKWECNGPEPEKLAALPHSLISKDHDSTPAISGASAYYSLNSISVEIPAFDLAESTADEKPSSVQRTTDFAYNTGDGNVCSPSPIGLKSLWPLNKTNSCSSPLGDILPVWTAGKTNVIHSGFGSGPRKPRTQVQYALPYGGSEFGSKHKSPNQNGPSYRRIRRASEKGTSDSRGSQRNLELLACNANVLITLGDRGWRECGARVILELADHNEWRLAVKFSGSTKYSHKVHHIFQPGSTNRYTHAMMWKGGKDWALEFPDRSQWMLFKEMHEECHNRNIRAASVKNIPIPGVRVVEECEFNTVEFPFNRSSPKYFRQFETDVDMAMNPGKILYDMDSDDEHWILENVKSFQTQEGSSEVLSDELFEKIMDMFEKFAYAQQCDRFTVDEVENLMVGVAPMEMIKSIHQHWQQKRQRTGMPLIRHLQPPSWERYQQQMKEWNQLMTKANNAAACGGQAAPPMEKPAMFAFCLKPRGLEVLNKGSKHRSQKRLPVAGHSHAHLGDQDGLHSFGRRLNSFSFKDEKAVFPSNSPEYSDSSPKPHKSTRCSPRDSAGPGYFLLSNDACEWNNNPNHHRKKSKKVGMFLGPGNLQMVPSNNQRIMGKRNGMEFPEWPSQKYHQSEVSVRHGAVQLGGRDLDEFRLRDASGAAQHARNMARLKRDKAQRLLSRADLAIHKAVSALMTADAVKASFAGTSAESMQEK